MWCGGQGGEGEKDEEAEEEEEEKEGAPEALGMHILSYLVEACVLQGRTRGRKRGEQVVNSPQNSLASILSPHGWAPSNRVSAVRTTISNQFHSSSFNPQNTGVSVIWMACTVTWHSGCEDNPPPLGLV